MSARTDRLRIRLTDLRDRVRGETRATSRFWEMRHTETPEVWPAYWETRTAPYRAALVERLEALPSTESFLEVGCANGPNLWALARRLPDARLSGSDISSEAIGFAREALAAEGIEAELAVASADELPYPDDAFDVVLSAGLTVCIGPDRIEPTLRELIRVARTTVFLLEGRTYGGEEEVMERYPNTKYWRRDYPAILRRLTPEAEIRAQNVPENLVHGHLDTYIELALPGSEQGKVVR